MGIGSEINYEDEAYFNQRMKERLYFSKEFTDKFTGNKKRFVHKVNESEMQRCFVKVKEEIILSETFGGKHQLKALLLEDPREIHELVIQKFTSETGSPHKFAYSFRNREIKNLYDFLRGIYKADLSNPNKIIINDDALDEVLLSAEQANKLVIDNEDIVINAIKNNITKSDIMALGYRKAQLNIFQKLLTDNEYFEKYKQNEEIRKDETVWQRFFEKNTWILGYGLNYILNAPLEGEKLEQIVNGATVFQKGKRIDALMKTKGIINSLCFGEIKTHKTSLLQTKKEAYRGESWAVSDELAGAIAQIQRSIQRSIENIKTKIEVKDNYDNLTGEQLFLYTPRAFLIIGSLEEFVIDERINESKYSSFEIFRRNINGIEIITYDELYERASFIVRNIE